MFRYSIKYRIFVAGKKMFKYSIKMKLIVNGLQMNEQTNELHKKKN